MSLTAMPQISFMDDLDYERHLQDQTRARLADLERRRAALHRRSRALKGPTDPADEPAFLAALEAIEHETAELAAAKVALDKA